MKKTWMIPLFAFSLLIFTGCSSTPCDEALEHFESTCQNCGGSLVCMAVYLDESKKQQCEAYQEKLSPEEQEKLKDKMQKKMEKMPCLGKSNKKDKDKDSE